MCGSDFARAADLAKFSVPKTLWDTVTHFLPASRKKLDREKLFSRSKFFSTKVESGHVGLILRVETRSKRGVGVEAKTNRFMLFAAISSKKFPDLVPNWTSWKESLGCLLGRPEG